MLVLLRESQGQTRQIRVEGDTATIGRAEHCDIVVDEPFVSKQHVKLMTGVVAVDLDSSNGTYIDGERVRGAAVLGSRWIQLGQSKVALSVEPEPEFEMGAEATLQLVGNPEVDELRAEIARLREQLASAEQPAREQTPDADRARLERENLVLKKRVEQLEQAQPQAAPVAPPVPATLPVDAPAASKLIFKLQQENAELKRSVVELTAQVGGSVSAPPPPAARPAPPPVPARTVTRGGEGKSAGRALDQLRSLIQQDVEAIPPDLQADLETFLLVEGYRFLRRIERVVTRLAGGLIELYQLNTIVPGMEGNLRELVGKAMESPRSASDREALLEYLRELGRWLVVSLGAYRQAAAGFAAQVREDITEAGLTRDAPIPVLRRFAGGKEAELWRRLCAYAAGLSPDLVAERVEKLARGAADELMDTEAQEAFS